jgi:predicted PurR-regulated permease PerM
MIVMEDVTRRSSGLRNSRLSMRTVFTLICVAVILYVGQEIFVPLALALLLTFTLAPIVTFLRKRRVPRVLAVILAVGSAFLVIAVFSIVVASQVANLAENITVYQRNIITKVQTLTQAGSGDGILEHLNRAVERVGAELQEQDDKAKDAGSTGGSEPAPIPVQVVPRSDPMATIGNIIFPLISPFATAGLVIVLVVFMLLEREDLRDRFIRLVGLGDLHKTTSALQDAGSRVGRYLLMQLVVNALYALPISAGLWLLGIPNAILWGLLTLVLRFVPYIGPVIGMIFPLFLALAIAPGWSLVFWVAALFIVVELVSNNVVEPWLYGSQTGLSSLAIIVSAIFWSWLWGPIGLMLSTPLTVCLVVLGRYVPQFGFLDVLLGNEPVLQPQERLYQRLLAGDPNEATDNAEEFLEHEQLITYFEKVALPALALGEADRQRGVMSDKQIDLFSQTTKTLVENLAEILELEEDEPDPDLDEAEAVGERTVKVGDRRLACLGGRGAIDEAATAMVEQVLLEQNFDVARFADGPLGVRSATVSTVADIDTVLVTFMSGSARSYARQAVRRLKRLKPSLRVGIFAPMADGENYPKLEAGEISADFVSTTIADVLRDAMAEEAAVELRMPARRLSAVRHSAAPA